MAGGGPPRMRGRSRSSCTEMFLVLLLLLVNAGLPGVRGETLDRALEEDRHSCYETVSSWSEEQLHQLLSTPAESALERIKLRDLLFFLHIPRTGGRTFHQCFLKHLLPIGQRCPRSYDTLRIDRAQPGCRLISTHDDYSLLENLPEGMTSVVTTLRDPVDRVLSSYEFSIEVAARFLRNQGRRVPVPLNNSRPKASAAAANGGNFMNTIDIWPWKYLVPMMEKDLHARRKAAQAMKANATGLSENDSYDAAEIAMPFDEFLDHPAAHELVHNGATFQVAGLTNTSFSADAARIRQCVIRFPRLGEFVVEVAKKRLDMMLYVGLTERQNESVVFFAKALGEQISRENFMHSIMSNPGAWNRSQTEGQSWNKPRLLANFTSLDEFTEEQMIEEILAAYKRCVTELRRGQERRRATSLQTLKPIQFSREMRKLIPAHVMKKVANFNLLDTELYAYAENLFQEQQLLLRDESLHFLKQVQISGEDVKDSTQGLQESDQLTDDSTQGLLAGSDELTDDSTRGLVDSDKVTFFWDSRTLWVFSILTLTAVSCVLTKRRVHRKKEF